MPLAAAEWIRSLAPRLNLSKLAFVIGFLRFLGVINAAIWFGAAIFFTVAVGPAFFSPEMTNVIPPPYNGVAAQVVLKRFFILQHWCALMAFLHLLAEWLYMGRPLERITLLLLTTMFCIGLLGGFWIQPKLKELHRVKYSTRSAPIEKQQATRSFGIWHGVAQSMNLFVTVGLLVYLWRITSAPSPTRFVSANKFRG